MFAGLRHQQRAVMALRGSAEDLHSFAVTREIETQHQLKVAAGLLPITLVASWNLRKT